jgi:hypothetical protein
MFLPCCGFKAEDGVAADVVESDLRHWNAALSSG